MRITFPLGVGEFGGRAGQGIRPDRLPVQPIRAGFEGNDLIAHAGNGEAKVAALHARIADLRWGN